MSTEQQEAEIGRLVLEKADNGKQTILLHNRMVSEAKLLADACMPLTAFGADAATRKRSLLLLDKALANETIKRLKDTLEEIDSLEKRSFEIRNVLSQAGVL
jgi:hypothetical protein